MKAGAAWLILVLSCPLCAAAQSGDDPTLVPQLSPYAGPQRSDIEAQQLNLPLAHDDGAIDQLSQADRSFQVNQVEDGTDLCDAEGADREFCRNAPRVRSAADGRRRVLPEETLAIGAPSAIDQFSRDPARAADEIARGELSSLAAQSFGSSLLGLQNPPPKKEEDQKGELLDLSTLPPEILQGP